jgi:hypothetical protein
MSGGVLQGDGGKSVGWGGSVRQLALPGGARRKVSIAGCAEPGLDEIRRRRRVNSDACRSVKWGPRCNKSPRRQVAKIRNHAVILPAAGLQAIVFEPCRIHSCTAGPRQGRVAMGKAADVDQGDYAVAHRAVEPRGPLIMFKQSTKPSSRATARGAVDTLIRPAGFHDPAADIAFSVGGPVPSKEQPLVDAASHRRRPGGADAPCSCAAEP